MLLTPHQQDHFNLASHSLGQLDTRYQWGPGTAGSGRLYKIENKLWQDTAVTEHKCLQFFHGQERRKSE